VKLRLAPAMKRCAKVNRESALRIAQLETGNNEELRGSSQRNERLREDPALRQGLVLFISTFV
jgi:hypothetical protein